MDAIDGRWRGLNWELIPEIPLDPALNVAVDEVLLHEVAAGRRLPTLRFWGWAASAVVLGSFQSVANEVDHEQARARGVTVVRRISGGGAMFIQPEAAITYSLYLPEAAARGLSFTGSYAALDRWAVEGLRGLGVQARYEPLNDIAAPDGKIGGAAQARRSGTVLHHTTIAYEMDATEMECVLRIGRPRLSDVGVASAAKRVSPLRRQTALPRPAIVDHLIDGFRRAYGLREGALAVGEVAQAKRLVRDKFAAASWTYKLP